MGLEFKTKTTNLIDDIEEELFKSLKVKISLDDIKEKSDENNQEKEKATKE